MTSASALIADLSRVGVRLERRGDRLHIEAPKGSVTPELRLVLTEHKAELLEALNDDPRAQLERIADAEGIDAALIRSLSDHEIAGCADLPVEALHAYVHALDDADTRRRGKVPTSETARALCARCGPVWVHPAVAAVAPVVNGWARLLGCPWCLVRTAGRYVPRPPVQCNDCKHIVRDAVNPEGGMCRCAAVKDIEHMWPSMSHNCNKYEPTTTQPGKSNRRMP